MKDLRKIGSILLEDKNTQGEEGGGITMQVFYVLVEPNPECNVSIIDDKIARIVKILDHGRAHLRVISHVHASVLLAMWHSDTRGRINIFFDALMLRLKNYLEMNYKDGVIAANATGYLLGGLRILTERADGPLEADEVQTLRFLSDVFRLTDCVEFRQEHLDLLGAIVVRYLTEKPAFEHPPLRALLEMLRDIVIPRKEGSFINAFSMDLCHKIIQHRVGAFNAMGMLLSHV